MTIRWDRDIAGLLPTVVTVSTAASVDAYGGTVWSTGTPARARVILDRRERRTGRGDSLVTTGTVWLEASTWLLSTQHAVGVAGRIYPVLLVEAFPDEQGRWHHKLGLGVGRAWRGTGGH